MNFGTALSFVFKDIDWFKKVLVGGLLNFFAMYTGIFFFVAFFPFGYVIEVIRQNASDKDSELPDWDDLGNKFINGLLGSLIILFYVIIFGGLGALWIVYVSTTHSFQEPTQVILIVIGALFILFGILYFGTSGVALFALKGNFVDAFNFSEGIRFIQSDFYTFTIVILFSLFLGFVMFLAGFAILSPFTVFWANLVFAHLIAQYAIKSFPGWQAEKDSSNQN